MTGTFGHMKFVLHESLLHPSSGPRSPEEWVDPEATWSPPAEIGSVAAPEASLGRPSMISTWETHIRLIWSLLQEWVSEGSVILEVGGGHSPFDHVRGLINVNKISTDMNFEELKRAKRGAVGQAYDLVVADGHQLPFVSSSVDVIIAAYVFEHLADPHRFLSEARRVLRPGGFVFAITPNLANPIAFPIILVPVALRERLLRRLGGHPDHPYLTYLRANSLRRLRTLATRTDFTVLKTSVLWEDHYLGKLRMGRMILDLIDRWGSGTPLEDFAGRLYVLLRKNGDGPRSIEPRPGPPSDGTFARHRSRSIHRPKSPLHYSRKTTQSIQMKHTR